MKYFCYVAIRLPKIEMIAIWDADPLIVATAINATVVAGDGDFERLLDIGLELETGKIKISKLYYGTNKIHTPDST